MSSDDDSLYNSDDLSDMLNDLDIHNSVLDSFHASMVTSGRLDHGESGHEGSESGEPRAEGETAVTTAELEEEQITEAVPDELLDQQDRLWAKRLRRDELYSKRYKATPAEAAELKELEKTLGIQDNLANGFFDAMLGKKEDSPQKTLWDQAVNATGELKQPQSIVLKRGPCLWLSALGRNEDSSAEPSKETECELILLTNGLVVAHVIHKGKSVSRQLARVLLWSQLRYVQPYPSAEKPNEWQILLKGNEVWTFVCASENQQRYWLRAMEKVVVQYHMHMDTIPDMGWQYRYIHKPAFSMAIDPDRMDAVRPPAQALSKLDRYQGYSPLHYAVRAHNARAVKCLLKIGADPNLPDLEEGRTPTDFAVQDDSTPPVILEMLESSGGTVRASLQTGKGALFSQVAAVEEKRKQEKKEQQRKAEAEAAQQQMNENMRLLQQRGEQINELGSKATELNHEASDFGDLARKLKEKSKKQNSWLPF